MILERIESWARSAPTKTAVVYNGRPLTYRQFADAIWAAHHQLMRLAPPSEGVAAILAYDLLGAWLLTMAARAAGLTTVAVSTLPELVALAIRDLACVVVAEHERSLAQGSAAPPGARFLFVPLKAQADPPPSETRRPIGDQILYTSGTTGTYKRVSLEGRLEGERNEARARILGLSSGVIYHAFDFGLWTGLGFRSSSAVWSVGGCVVIDQTPERYANFFRYGITCAHALSEMLRQLTAAHAARLASPIEPLTLRATGGFTPLNLAEQTVARLTPNLDIAFAATEVLATVMGSRFRSLDDLHWLTPQEGREVQVADEDGAPLPAGVEGQLRIKLTALDTHAYLDDETASTRAFRDGFFYPGDLAVLREDGRVRVLGRAADVINIGGQKLAVGPIEERLRQGLGVDEICVFSGLTASGEEELVLAVRSARPADERELEARLGETRAVQRVRVKIFPDFPRTNTGKTRRTELRRMLFGE
jgi:acyl-coenzyme A synthetase/AMP-(fatty) acid ligase